MMRAALAGMIIAGLATAQQPAFDAASVKVFDRAAGPPSPETSDPGRIHFGGATMLNLLMRAYDAKMDQISGPAWISDFGGPNRYDITATMPPGTTKEQVRLMLQSLLVERFHLAVHHEMRNFPGYELVVAKDGPKLKESIPDPNDPPDGAPAPIPTFKDGHIQFPPGPRMTITRGTGILKVEAHENPISDLMLVLGPMITQSLGADMMDPGPRARVVDKTGLTGRYDFTVQWECKGCRGLAGMNLPLLAGRGQPDSGAASEPVGSGLPTIFVVFERQLGLRLEKVKDIPLDVVIVDHIDKLPTAN